MWCFICIVSIVIFVYLAFIIAKINAESYERVKAYNNNYQANKGCYNIKGNLNEDELVFLKFISNKNINITFSPRWNYLNPQEKVKKFLKNKLIKYSDFNENLKLLTIKELKELLKDEGLKVTGNKEELMSRLIENVSNEILKTKINKTKYVLTDKGKKLLLYNKELFMSDREKAGEDFAELTDYEYNFLNELNQTGQYAMLKNNELSFGKGYNKNDILWSIYNNQKDVLYLKRNYEKVSIIYDKMFRICFDEKKYTSALIFFICSSYLEGYNTIKELKENDLEEMKNWFYINISDLKNRIAIIEEETHILRDKGIDWLISNSIDKYLKGISRGLVKKAFKEKLEELFKELNI